MSYSPDAWYHGKMADWITYLLLHWLTHNRDEWLPVSLLNGGDVVRLLQQELMYPDVSKVDAIAPIERRAILRYQIAFSAMSRRGTGVTSEKRPYLDDMVTEWGAFTFRQQLYKWTTEDKFRILEILYQVRTFTVSIVTKVPQMQSDLYQLYSNSNDENLLSTEKKASLSV